MIVSKNIQEFYYAKAYKIYLYCFIIFFFLQLLFWFNTNEIRPKYDIVPQVPNKYIVSVISLGDKEFLFRALGERLQNSGDVFAGFVALKNYNYPMLYQWFKMLDGLNGKSNFIPALASYYYSQTQNTKDTIYVINYLDEHSSKNIDDNWWWMYHAMMIARKDLKDKDKALELAYKLSNNKAEKAPIWTREFPALIHSEMGDDCLAFRVTEKIIKDNESGARKLQHQDLELMRYFINKQLSTLKKQGFNPNKC